MTLVGAAQIAFSRAQGLAPSEGSPSRDGARLSLEGLRMAVSSFPDKSDSLVANFFGNYVDLAP